MTQKPKIKAQDIVRDVRTGLSDAQIMQKYGLSAKGLLSAFKKLLACQAINPAEIYGRSHLYADSIALEDMHRLFSNYLPFEVAIYESENLDSEGVLEELSERGLRVRGIKAEVDEEKGFLIPADEFDEIDPIAFDAICHWVDVDNTGQYTAGFEIVRATKNNLLKLNKMLQLIRSGT